MLAAGDALPDCPEPRESVSLTTEIRAAPSASPLAGMASPQGSALEVLRAFAWLGVSCFGGPIAHIGYFRNEFVTRRRWLGERAFADLVALCQFAPGPASSQVGFSLGLIRGGWLGGLAAWCGFTLPSALLMTAFAFGASTLTGSPAGAGLLHGLKLVAVAIVAQAVWGMAGSLCPDRQRASIATAALVLVLFVPSSVGQIAAIVLGALVGLALCRDAPGQVQPAAPEALPLVVSRWTGAVCLALFGLLLALTPALYRLGGGAALFGAMYRSGALVFGGGHVVLPLLRQAVVAPGWVNDNAFLAGYGAAQALPGPLFTFSAYLGAVAHLPPGGVLGAIIALLGIFVPGILILVGMLPFWEALRRRAWAQALMRGVNAAVVGVLSAALYSLVWVSAVQGPADFAIAAVGFVLLMAWRAPPLLVVVFTAAAGVAEGLLG
jgi:chromate transporter